MAYRLLNSSKSSILPKVTSITRTFHSSLPRAILYPKATAEVSLTRVYTKARGLTKYKVFSKHHRHLRKWLVLKIGSQWSIFMPSAFLFMQLSWPRNRNLSFFFRFLVGVDHATSSHLLLKSWRTSPTNRVLAYLSIWSKWIQILTRVKFWVPNTRSVSFCSISVSSTHFVLAGPLGSRIAHCSCVPWRCSRVTVCRGTQWSWCSEVPQSTLILYNSESGPQHPHRRNYKQRSPQFATIPLNSTLKTCFWIVL